MLRQRTEARERKSRYAGPFVMMIERRALGRTCSAGAGRLAAAVVTLVVTVLAVGLVGPGVAHAASAITFDGSPGTNAPPSTLGPYTMGSFASDSQGPGAVSGVAAPGGGSLGFEPALQHLTIGAGWATWSNGYTGDVYWTQGATSVTVTLPAGTQAFYFYAEPNPFATFDIMATTQDGASSGPIAVDGASGARYFGFYTDGSTTLQTITASSSVDFAIGEFGISQGKAKPQASILFLHGVNEKSTVPFFVSMFQQVTAAVPGVTIEHFDYFQDKADTRNGGGCDPALPGQQPVALPNNLAGLPIDTSQNSPAHCDSEGDIGQNAIRLDQTIQEQYRETGAKVILVGYSMGGETIRAFLSYSTQADDGVASGMLDSVVLLHGVEQGSWLAEGGKFVAGLPFAGTVMTSLVSLFAPNPNRLATQEFNPNGAFLKWVDSRSTKLPDIPYYNTWGDERLVIHHCYLPSGRGCVNSDLAHWGDMVLLPGTDNPTETPKGGGERFLPNGYAADRWEWAETYQVNWNPLTDPLQVGAISSMIKAPQQHTNYPNQQASVTLQDCKTGENKSADTEISRVIIARLQGGLYACDPSRATP